MTSSPLPTMQTPEILNIKEIANHCSQYKGADIKRSLFQLITTLGLFGLSCSLMYYSLNLSYWLTLLMAFPTAGLLCRLFIFQHDCGHRSFFNSQTANDWVGRFLSILTVVPYDFWRRSHNLHHATSGNLDKCGVGDIDVLTVQEYMKLSNFKKILYRFYRNPITLLILGTPVYIILLQRIPYTQGAYFRETFKKLSLSSTWKSTIATDLGLIVFYGLLIAALGLGVVVSIALPILIINAWFSGWAFFVQHQFEDTYWENNENWNIQEAGLMGSSYYALPKIIQWFSGNIGLHHIHHMCSQIPNYKLQECMDARPELKDINKLTFIQSLKCVRLKLWDEDKKQLIHI